MLELAGAVETGSAASSVTATAQVSWINIAGWISSDLFGGAGVELDYLFVC